LCRDGVDDAEFVRDLAVNREHSTGHRLKRGTLDDVRGCRCGLRDLAHAKREDRDCKYCEDCFAVHEHVPGWSCLSEFQAYWTKTKGLWEVWGNRPTHIKIGTGSHNGLVKSRVTWRFSFQYDSSVVAKSYWPIWQSTGATTDRSGNDGGSEADIRANCLY
jgi:hypothetical protein